MSGNVFIDPLDLTEFNPSAPGDSPGFTQLVQDVLGTGASALDGFDAALADASALVDALDAATGEQDAALDAILVTLDTANPAQLDNSMLGYASTAPVSAAFIDTFSALTPPELLELPINPGTGAYNNAPPVQESIDLGTRPLGAAPIVYTLGTFLHNSHGSFGILSVSLFLGDGRVFTVSEVDKVDTDTTSSGSFILTAKPAVVGAWIAQVNVYPPAGAQKILTFKLTVTP